MIICPECGKSGIDIVDSNQAEGTLKYQCCYCNWTGMMPIPQPIIITKDTTGARDRDTRLLAIPENSGLGTKRLSPAGNSQHVFIDRRMMDAAGVKTGDLIHVLIWRIASKWSEVEDHE